jgi:hypothetical protein
MLWLDLVRAAGAMVLVAAGVSKLVSSTSVAPFLAAVGVPAGGSRWLARVLPFVELLCGAVLAVGVGVWSVYPAAALTVGFAAVLVWARFLGVTDRCACFGVLEAPHGAFGALARAVLLAVAMVSAAFAANSAAADRLSVAELTVGGLAAGAYIAVFTVLGSVWSFQRYRRESAARVAATRAARGDSR